DARHGVHALRRHRRLPRQRPRPRLGRRARQALRAPRPRRGAGPRRRRTAAGSPRAHRLSSRRFAQPCGLTNPRSTAKPPPMGDDPLAPSLLLAMPQLRDPNFSRAVVLLCEHGPEGAVGFVVNRPTDISAASAVALDPPPKRDSGMRLWTGGPVETNRG